MNWKPLHLQGSLHPAGRKRKLFNIFTWNTTDFDLLFWKNNCHLTWSPPTAAFTSFRPSVASSTFSWISGSRAFSSSISFLSSGKASGPSAVFISSSSFSERRASWLTEYTEDDLGFCLRPYPSGSWWQRWSCSAPQWQGCIEGSGCTSSRAGSGSRRGDGCSPPGASPAASDTPGSPPGLVCSFLKVRGDVK